MAKKKPSRHDRFLERTQGNPSESRLTLARNLAFGAGAACLVVLVEIIQVGASAEPLRIAVIASAIGMPSWIAIGAIVEVYIAIGKRSYPHLRKKWVRHFLGLMQFVAGSALVTMVGAVLWHLVNDALYVFVIAILSCVAVILAFTALMAHWWYGPDGPESDEDKA